MTTIFEWLSQHTFGKVALALSILWLGIGFWRWWQCRRRHSALDLPALLPLLLAVAAPLLMLKGIQLGLGRLDAELSGLTALEPWEGLRALTLIRHAVNGFWTWSTPLVSSGVACLCYSAVLAFWHSLWSFDLFWVRRRHKPNELQLIREELASLRQLLLEIKERPELLRDAQRSS